MPRRPHGFAQALSALATFSLVAACGSAPSDESAADPTAPTLDRASGLHVEGKVIPLPPPVAPPIAPPVPIDVLPAAPPGAASSQCIARTNCGVSASTEPDGAYTVPGYGVIRGGGGLEPCDADTSFTDQLTAMECSLQATYTWVLPSKEGVASVPIAFCPHAPVDALIRWEVMPCDSCTGEAPPGWVIVAWTNRGRCNGGAQPGGSCDDGGCLPAITE